MLNKVRTQNPGFQLINHNSKNTEFFEKDQMLFTDCYYSLIVWDADNSFVVEVLKTLIPTN